MRGLATLGEDIRIYKDMQGLGFLKLTVLCGGQVSITRLAV